MSMIRRIAPLAVVALAAAAGTSEQDAAVALVPVKYDALKQEVAKHRGKVLIVDFWAGY